MLLSWSVPEHVEESNRQIKQLWIELPLRSVGEQTIVLPVVFSSPIAEDQALYRRQRPGLLFCNIIIIIIIIIKTIFN